MIKSHHVLIVLFVAAFLLGLLATAPAALLGVALHRASQGRLELANCNGTLWHGSAVPILHRHSPDEGIVHLSALRWDISPWHLLTLQARITLNWQDDKQAHPVDISASPRQINITNLYLPLPASLLGELSSYLRPAGLGGRIIVKSDALSITSRALQGTLVADWSDADSALSSISPLGNYRFVITGHKTGGDFTLESTSGILLLNGSGHYDAAGSASFVGRAQAAEGQQEKLGELLRNLGPEVAPGQHSFSFNSN
jgi:general secretion pathway protein N